jgi:PKD repeat protein
MHNIKTLSRLFLACFLSLMSTGAIVSQNCAGFYINNSPENGSIAYAAGADYSQYGGSPIWTIAIGNQENFTLEGSSVLLTNNLLQEVGVNEITLCFSWGENNTACNETACASYNYNSETGQLEIIETAECEASFSAAYGENGLVLFENTSSNQAGAEFYQWQTGGDTPAFSSVNAEAQYNFSGPVDVCLTMFVYQENQQVCQDDTCVTIDIQLQELVCEEGYSPFYVEVLTCCEAEYPNNVFFTLMNVENETYISQVIPVPATAQALITSEFCVPDGCYDIQFDYSRMIPMVQQTSYIVYGSDAMTNEDIFDTFEDLPWTSSFCLGNITNECPTEIISQEMNCNTFVFELAGVDGGEIIWNFGDNSSTSNGLVADHQYAENGTFLVTALYASASCESVTITTAVDVDCGNDCPQNITTLNTNTCGQYIFFVNNAGPNAQVVWNAGDGSEPNTTSGEFVHQFENPGMYEVCAQVFTQDCPQGVTLCSLLEVAECNSNDCPNNIAFEQIDCNTFLFNINDNNTGYAIWDFGDGTNNYDFQGNPEHSFSENGIYVVTAEYFGPGCQAGVNLVVTVIAACESELCPESISITSSQLCHQYLFEVNNWGESIYGDILWDFGDNEGYGQNEFLHMYLESGNYEVCAEGTTELCPSGFSLCTPLQVEACGGDSNEDGCPDWIWGYPVNDCGLWLFEAGIFESENQNVLWNWGDGTFSDGNTIAEHQYTEDGIYIVTLTYSSADCDQTTVIYTVKANVCETSDCPQEIWSGEGEECGVMLFEAGGFVEGESFIWYFGDGSQAEGGHFITHTYTEPGIYNVCCVLSNANCPGYQLCTSIVVEECNTTCTNIVLGIDSYVNDGGTENLYYSVMNSDYEFVVSGMLEYSESDPFFDTMLCLPDGCYYLTIDNDNPITLGEGLNIFLMSNNENLMENAEIISQDEISFTIMFGVNSDCIAPVNCEAQFEHLYTATPGLVSFINNSTGNANTTCYWDFGNGTTSTDWSPQVQYTDNGVYLVCLTIMDGNCSHKYCHNVVVENLTIVCQDNLVEITITGNFNSNTQELIQILVSQDDLPVDDLTVIYSNEQVSLTGLFCYPDGCYELSYTATSPIQAEAFNVTIESNDAIVMNTDLPLNESSGNVVFGLDTDCTISTENIELENKWLLYPVPANDVLMITGLTNEKHDIEIFDMAGKMIFNSSLNSQSFTINSSQWAEGVYVAKVISGSRVASRRFEIIH